MNAKCNWIAMTFSDVSYAVQTIDLATDFKLLFKSVDYFQVPWPS